MAGAESGRMMRSRTVRSGAPSMLAASMSAVGIARKEVAEELGGEHRASALVRVAPDVVADDFFGVALGVRVGGVNEVAAALEEVIEEAL